MSGTRVAMVAALEREVWPWVKDWAVNHREHEGRRFKFFEKKDVVLVCGGIGAEAARRATEAIIALYQPKLVQSVGFAGALDSTLKVGAIVVPSRVINAPDGSRVEIKSGHEILVSFSSIASVEQKAKLAKAYGAQAVDMEAAAVAVSAQTHKIEFSAVKAVSDEVNCELPAMKKFIGGDGSFRLTSFVVFAAIRPWLWPRLIRLQRNSAAASKALCQYLAEEQNQVRNPGENGKPAKNQEKVENSAPEAHPMSGARI